MEARLFAKLEELTTSTNTIKQELINKLEDTRTQTVSELQSTIESLRQENVELKKSYTMLEARVGAFECASPSSPSTIHNLHHTLQSKITSAAADAVEKQMRKNNIIVCGFKSGANNIRDNLNNFIQANLGIADSIVEASLVRKNNKKIKATIKDGDTKRRMMSQKSKLKRPVFFNHDLTPQESLISKKLRDEVKCAKLQNKKVKMGFLKLMIVKTCYTYDSHLDEIIPVTVNHCNSNSIAMDRGSTSMDTSFHNVSRNKRKERKIT